jgi:hypothetical protein
MQRLMPPQQMVPGLRKFFLSQKRFETPMKHGKQIQIARAANITGKYLNDIIAGRKRAGRKLSVRLENLTGVPRMTWLFGRSDEIKAALDEGEAESRDPVPFNNIETQASLYQIIRELEETRQRHFKELGNIIDRLNCLSSKMVDEE